MISFMLKNLKVFFNNFRNCSYGVGYFAGTKYQIPRLQVDRRFNAKQIVNTGVKNYGKTRYATKKTPVQRARGLIKQKTFKKTR